MELLMSAGYSPGAVHGGLSAASGDRVAAPRQAESCA
jgi:hypothetical protein